MTEQAHPEWDASYTADARAPLGHLQAAAGFCPARRRGPPDRAPSRRWLRHRRERAARSQSWRGCAGIDVAPAAIARARAKASERGLTARFEVADALGLGRLSLTVDTVIDSERSTYSATATGPGTSPASRLC